MTTTRWMGWLLAGALAACAGGKSEVDEDFTDLAGQDVKADNFSWRLKLLGTVGDGVKRTLYTKTPRFRGWIFYADAGDEVTVELTSRNGDPVTWVLDTNFRVLAKNDDAGDDTYDSFIALTLPGNADRRYFVVFRDYDLESHWFNLRYTRAATTWDGQAKLWFDEQMAAGPWDTVSDDFVVEPDAFPMGPRARQLYERTEGMVIPWLAEVGGRELWALRTGWDDRFFVDLYDDAGRWFAHGWSILQDGRTTGIHWDFDDNDPTTCVCDGGSSARCTWIDGSVEWSGSIPCD